MRSWWAVSWMLLFLVLAQFAALPPAVLALTASEVYEQVKDSVVVVKAYNQQGRQVGQGSGVMLPSGDIVTNCHVVKSGVRFMVGQGKRGMLATLKASDPEKDLCLLSAPGLKAKPARLGKAAKLKVGEKVYAVGAPQGLELSLSEGIVSQLRGGPPPLIQTTVAISPGSSGGGLFNAEAELVGITTFYLKDSQSLNFALPVEWIGQVALGKSRERPGGQAPGAPVPGARPQGSWEARAMALEKAQDWQGLLEWCQKWTRAEPRNEAAWFNLGVAYGNLGRYRESIEAWRQTARLKPDNAATWYNLGFAYGKIGLYRESVLASREAARLRPNDASIWNNLGIAYGRLGRPRDEILAYREALRLKPDYAKAWYNLGLAYARTGNRTAALQAANELRRYNPQQAQKLYNLIMKQ
jgi:Flp pilus assembly protein TadD